MAVFKVNKTSNYTVMSNYHLKDKKLTLKAIGLLSKMLSLPGEWDFSLAGLVSICKEEETAVNNALKELERHGYLVRKKLRDNKGRITDVEYNIYEKPIENTGLYPNVENPKMDNPKMENQVQSNKDIIKDFILKSNTNLINQEEKEKKDFSKAEFDKKRQERQQIEELIKTNIEYDILYQEAENRKYLEAIMFVMLEILTTTSDTISIARKKMPTQVVKAVYEKIKTKHIIYIIKCLKENSSEIKNIKAYLQTTIYNSYSMIDLHTQVEVQHDYANYN